MAEGGIMGGIFVAVAGIIGVLIFYAVFNSVNTDSWDSSVVTLAGVVPIVLFAGVVLYILVRSL